MKIAPIVLAIVPLLRSVAWSCSCDGWVRFEGVRRGASLVVAARIVNHLPLPSSAPVAGVAAIDIELFKTLKGHHPGPRLRIWDQDVLTSCRHGLGKLTVGTIAVFALTRSVRLQRDALEEIRGNLASSPAPDDYVLANCREQWRVLHNEDELDQFTKGRRRAESCERSRT